MSSIINKKQARQHALDHAATTRAHPFTRVSSDFLVEIEADTRAAIERRIAGHPSMGKTLRGSTTPDA